jgi:hypothetical protein
MFQKGCHPERPRFLQRAEGSPAQPAYRARPTGLFDGFFPAANPIYSHTNPQTQRGVANGLCHGCFDVMRNGKSKSDSLLLPRDPFVDFRLQHIERQWPLIEYCIVKCSYIELRTQFMLRSRPQLQNFRLPHFVR